METSRPLIDAGHHRLTVAPPAGPVDLEADPVRLAQVFSNLLNNAAKYTEPGGHIWLTAERVGGEVVVSVRDTGIGIDPEHLPRIFDMFAQVDRRSSGRRAGWGSACRWSRGWSRCTAARVEAASAGSGMGSEFTVHLPVAEAPAAAATGPVDDGEGPHRPARRRILVVDDNLDAARTLARLLKLSGHEVETAHDGLEAVQAAAASRPDVVLLDIGLPRLNGYEAAARIRSEPWGQDMLIVALTGWGQEEDRRRARGGVRPPPDEAGRPGIAREAAGGPARGAPGMTRGMPLPGSGLRGQKYHGLRTRGSDPARRHAAFVHASRTFWTACARCRRCPPGRPVRRVDPHGTAKAF